LTARRAAATSATRSTTERHSWAFRAKFRKGALGWRGSAEGVSRVRGAVAEIRKSALTDVTLAAEGFVVLVERISPAFQNVDDSSGALGSEIRAAVAELVPVFKLAQLTDTARDKLLSRIWQAAMNDETPWIECVQEHFGELCATSAAAEVWLGRTTDQIGFAGLTRRKPAAYLEGEIAVPSLLYFAGRHRELMDFLTEHGSGSWTYRRWGFRELVDQLKYDEAIAYAIASKENCHRTEIARACEELLNSLGRVDEAYDRFAHEAIGYKPTYAARFKALAERYPAKDPSRLLRDLIARSPGEEGKWFAAAMSAGLTPLALELAQHYPAEPKTLARAAGRSLKTAPQLAFDLSVAALRWMSAGYGYELTDLDIVDAFNVGLAASEKLGLDATEYRKTVRHMLDKAHPFMRQTLSKLVE
jgi:hypothetical protein